MNKKLFLALISIPGLSSLLPTLNQVYIKMITQLPGPVISYSYFLIISLLQSCILITGSIFLGSWATKNFNWQDNTLNAIEAHNIHALKLATTNQLIPSMRYSLPAALCFVITIHVLLFPFLDKNMVAQMNDFSMPSLMMRIFYGGIIEEILLRWNILSILVLLSIKIFKQNVQNTWWIAIIISAILFGCGHLPMYFATAIKPTISTIFLIIATNSYAGIFFGWIFKRFGLISAMIAHILFHVTWFLIHVIISMQQCV